MAHAETEIARWNALLGRGNQALVLLFPRLLAPWRRMTAEDHHFHREDRVLRWQRIASHIAEHPENLSIPLANCDRWLALGRVHPGPLREWQRLITTAQGSPEAFAEFISFLAAPNHDEQPIKSFSPFVGLPIESPT